MFLWFSSIKHIIMMLWFSLLSQPNISAVFLIEQFHSLIFKISYWHIFYKLFIEIILSPSSLSLMIFNLSESHSFLSLYTKKSMIFKACIQIRFTCIGKMMNKLNICLGQFLILSLPFFPHSIHFHVFAIHLFIQYLLSRLVNLDRQ